MTAPLLHEAEKVRGFLDYINNRQNNIQFTIGTTTEDHLPSLDINIYSYEDGSLGHKSTRVHRKMNNRNLYLTVRTHHQAKSTHTSARSTSPPNCT